MKIRRCIDCGRFLGEDTFHFANREKGWKKSECKRCSGNRDYLWKLDNLDYDKQYAKYRYENNKEHIKKYDKQYARNNFDIKNAINAKRRARKKDATPELMNHELKKIDLYYQISNYLGPGWEVDHIIPLSKGGLHYPDNLQIITKEDNRKKYNNLDYEANYSFRI